MEYAKQSKLLERWITRFEKLGDTFSANILGVPAVCRINPLNIQVMLGADFKDYGVQPMRRSATLPFLGEGVFTMIAHEFADSYIDKAIEYRTNRLANKQPTEEDKSGRQYVSLHDMAMKTDNRIELRSQIMHAFLAGHESSAIAYTLASMAQKWKYLECRDEVKEWVEELRVSTSSRNGVKVALIAE